MNRTYTSISIIILLLVVIALGAYAYTGMRTPEASPVVSEASYLCRDGKTIDASYTGTGVSLTLSDGRYLTLPQVVSGSGIRYESGTTSFLSKGDNAFLEEAGVPTFVDCVANASAASATDAQGMRTFTDSGKTFSFMYPDSFTVLDGGVGYTEGWMNNATTSGLLLAKATLPKSFQVNTNFSEATLTVGTSADATAVATCLMYNPSGGPATASSKESINGMAFTKLMSSDAGAGNVYQTTSYRTVRDNQCYAVEYTIHSTNIGNYSPDQGINEFDRTTVENTLTDVVRSFRFTSS